MGPVEDERDVALNQKRLKDTRDKSSRSSSTDGTRSRNISLSEDREHIGPSSPKSKSNDKREKSRRSSSTDGISRPRDDGASPDKHRRSVVGTKGHNRSSREIGKPEEGTRGAKDRHHDKSPSKHRKSHDPVRSTSDGIRSSSPKREKSHRPRSMSCDKEILNTHQSRSPSRHNRRNSKDGDSPNRQRDESSKRTGKSPPGLNKLKRIESIKPKIEHKNDSERKGRQELLLDPEVAEFIQMLESVSHESEIHKRDSNDNINSLEKSSRSDKHKTDDSKSQKNRKESKETSKNVNNERRTKDTGDSEKGHKHASKKSKNGKIEMINMNDCQESDGSLNYLDLKGHPPKSHPSNEKTDRSVRGRGTDRVSGDEREKRSQSLRPDPPSKSKKKSGEEKNHDKKKEDGKNGLDKYFKGDKSDHHTQSTDDSSVRSFRRGSVAAWRELSKNKADKTLSPKKNLLHQEKDTNVDSQHGTAKSNEANKKILEAYRSGTIPALSNSSSLLTDNAHDTHNLLSNLPDDDADQSENYGYEEDPLSGYLPTGLGRKAGGMGCDVRQDDAGDVMRRRPSFVSASDFSDLSEGTGVSAESSNDSNGALNKRSAMVRQSSLSKLDSSQSGLNASFASLSMRGSRSTIKSTLNPSNFASAASLSSSSTNRKSQSLDGDAIESIMKSRRLRGDVVQRSKPKEEIKKTKKFLFV